MDPRWNNEIHQLCAFASVCIFFTGRSVADMLRLPRGRQLTHLLQFLSCLFSVALSLLIICHHLTQQLRDICFCFEVCNYIKHRLGSQFYLNILNSIIS